MGEEIRKGTVVVIDDEEKITELVVQILEMRGYQSTGYSDGQSAIESLTKVLEDWNGDISIILSDIRMPDKSGLETVDEILKLYKNGKEAKKPEIIFMSSIYNESEKNRAMKISNKPILDKPLSTKPLIEVINSANNDFYKRIEG